ncbi:MAG: ThiF family adenylyltransferase [Anaerolineae bacterium]|nr:ThiF family adenylyltransferase [Anaerolineae bacterium]
MAGVDERYVRQVQFPPIGREGQRRIQESTVVLIGCGALGSTIADGLVRAGVGKLVIVDRDYVEWNNLQRQMLFDEDDVRQQLPKAIAAARRLREINSTVEVEPVVADAYAGNIQDLIRGADVVLDGTDNFETRYLINDACVAAGIPWVYGGVVAASGMSMTIRPRESACLRCVFRDPPPPGSLPTCDVAGIISPIVRIIGAVEVSEALKLLTGSGQPNPGLLSVEVWDLTFERIELGGPAPDCPTCGRGEYSFLQAETGTVATSLCGRSGVQVAPRPPVQLDLAALAERLQGVGRVTRNEFLLRFANDECDMTVFPDGRAIIKGTTDPAKARTLYTRYIGG